MPATKDYEDDYHFRGGGDDDDDEMMTITTTEMSSITTLVNEFGGENNQDDTHHHTDHFFPLVGNHHHGSISNSNNNNNNSAINDDDTGNANSMNETNSIIIFWERAHVATCLKHSTLASSCAQVYREVAGDLNNDSRKKEEEIDETLVDNIDMVCEILGHGMQVCAYIRWDGSVAKNDAGQFNEFLFHRRRGRQWQHPPPSERQQGIPRYYTTAVVVECQMSVAAAAAAATTTTVAQSNYIKFHHNYNMQQYGESILSAMNKRQVEQLARLSGVYLTDTILLGKKGGRRRGRTMVDADGITTTTTTTISPIASSTGPPPPPTTTTTETSSWRAILHYPIATSLVQLLKSGTVRLVHGALSIIEGAEESDQYFDDAIIGSSDHNQGTSLDPDESSSLQVRKLLTKDVASSSETILRAAAAAIDTIGFTDEDDDDATTLTGRKKRQRQPRLSENICNDIITSALPPVGSHDMLISIAVVAYTCRYLLSFAQIVILSSRYDTGGSMDREEEEENVMRAAEKCDSKYRDFFVPLPDGDSVGARIMMYREGWDACSFGLFCRKAGGYFASQTGDSTATAPATASSPFTDSTTTTERQTLAQYGKILSDMTREEVDLLATTLCESNFAHVEKDIIILFPGGVPADFYSNLLGATTPTLISSSDFALFQVHVTKIAITNKLVRLERDATVAKNNAIKARRDNKDTTQLALMHMRRRKAALDELERCASLLSNLDACELRLERARDDVRLVQSYTYLRTALQDVRKSRDEVLIGSSSSYEDVEELMLDIREEMDEMNETNKRMNEIMTIEQYAEIDEAELNEEFRRLEMECESTANQRQSHPEVNEDQGSVNRLDPQLAPTTETQNEEPASSETLLPA